METLPWRRHRNHDRITIGKTATSLNSGLKIPRCSLTTNVIACGYIQKGPIKVQVGAGKVLLVAARKSSTPVSGMLRSQSPLCGETELRPDSGAITMF